MVTGSVYPNGSLEPGGGLRNCGLEAAVAARGVDGEEAAEALPDPVDWTVYFCGAIRLKGYFGGLWTAVAV